MSEKRFLVRRLIALFTLKRILIGVCVVVALHTLLNIWASVVLRRELDRARSAGIELDMHKYNQPEVPSGKNAAPLYRAAFELLRSLEKEAADAPHGIDEEWPGSGPPSPELQEKMSRFANLDRVATAYDLIEEANAMPECNWGLRYEDTFEMDLGHLGNLRRAVRALLVRARLRYVTGDRAGAVSDIQAVVRLAERIESDNILISELVQYATMSICVNAVRQMSTAEPFDADAAMQLCNSLTPWERLIGATEAFKLETAAAYFWTEKLRTNPGMLLAVGAGDPQPSSRHDVLGARFVTSYPYRPMYRLDQARLLRLELEMVGLSRQPYRAVKDRVDEWGSECETPRMPFFLSGLLLPALHKMQFNVAKARVQVRAARLGLALEACRAKTGSYPASLAALVPDYLPELPMDPFSGKSLLYKPSEEEILVYSVGKNGTDDGGRKETEEDGVKVNPGTDDIAWRVPR